MESPPAPTPEVFASPTEVAGKIAAAYGGQPSIVSVPMIGSREIESFVSEILEVQRQAHSVVLNLD
jgi:hypothetical protein